MGRYYTWFLLISLTVMSLIAGDFGYSEGKTKKKNSKGEIASLPREIVIFYPILRGSAGGVVEKIFTHESHAKEYKIACNNCHHTYKKGEDVGKGGVPVKRCSGCHEDPALKGEKMLVPGFQLKKLLPNASCKGCHMTGYLSRLGRYGVFPGR